MTGLEMLIVWLVYGLGAEFVICEIYRRKFLKRWVYAQLDMKLLAWKEEYALNPLKVKLLMWLRKYFPDQLSSLQKGLFYVLDWLMDGMWLVAWPLSIIRVMLMYDEQNQVGYEMARKGLVQVND